MVTYPQWATQERRNHLSGKLFQQYGNRCQKGHIACPVRSHYLVYTEGRQEYAAVEVPIKCVDSYGNKTGQVVYRWAVHLVPITVTYAARANESAAEACIDSWKQEDRERRGQLRRFHGSTLNDGTYGRYGARFDPVNRDVYHQTRPAYHFLTYGVSAASKQRIAVIRLPSTFIRLYVNVSEAVQEVNLSQNKRRKIKRYGHIRPQPKINDIVVDRLCTAAVREYLARQGTR